MGYQQQAYQTVVDELARRRNDALTQAENNRRHLHSLSSETKEIDAILAKTAMRIFNAAVSGGEAGETFESIETESKHLQAVRADLLASLGLPADYTEPHYTCPHCQDTGYVMTRMCACMKQLLQWEGMRASGIAAQMETQTFDAFSLSYYPEGACRDRMAQNLAIAREFAEGFRPGKDNLLLLGGTGLGKTHLSTAIARCVIEGGYSVVYETAQSVFDAFEKDRFHSGYSTTPHKESDRYLTCDLLILDDLGTEFSTSFTLSCLYQLINTRTLRGLSTVISTNLTAEEILGKYDDRLTSRILGLYRILKFEGTDIRRQKLLETLRG